MKIKISRSQYFFMIPNILYGKAIGITAGVTVRAVGGDVWIAMLIGFLMGTILVMAMTHLARKFPEKTIVQYSEELIGKGFSKIFGSLLAIYFGIAFAISVNVVTLHLKEYLLPETPFFLLCLLYGLLCIYGVWFGIEVVVRFSLFGFIMTILINATMILGTVADFRFINLRPILDRSIIENLRASIYSFSDSTMGILAIGMLYPMVKNKKNMGIISFGAMLLGSVVVLIWPFFETGVLGADVMKQFVVVCMQQVRSAMLTRYLPRYELIMVSFFVWGMVVQTSVMLYCCQYCIKQSTGIKKDSKILFVISVILIPVANYVGYDHNKYVNFLSYPWSQISAALGIGIPVIFLILSSFRRKNGKDISVET